MSSCVARVAFDSPLPQLDRLFDYEVPEHLSGEIAVGMLVSVVFGRGKKPQNAYVVELADSSDFEGQLAPIESIVSSRKLLTEPIYRLCRAIADRQGVTLGDVLRAAVPPRAVRVDKNWSPTEPAHFSAPTWVDSKAEAKAEAAAATKVLFHAPKSHIVSRHGQSESAWLFDALERAAANLKHGKSTIVCLPDFRDVDRFVALTQALGLLDFLNVYQKSATPSEQYARHLRALESHAQIVLGSRSVLYAPVENLAEIIVWDEGDQSHTDQASPYLSARDHALLRQSQSGCSLTFMGHVPSVALVRLAQLGYLTDQNEAKSAKVSFSDGTARFDSLAFNTIKAGLKSGPVLVQVANVGMAAGLYCSACSKRSQCSRCGGGLWLDSSNRATCRACSAFNLNTACQQCGSTERAMGRAGSHRTVEELGKSFAGVRVSESIAANVLDSVDDKPQIVVATPGLAPIPKQGYAAVVCVDSRVFLARDTLNATEDALRTWANALALLRPDGVGAVIGVPAQLGAQVATSNYRVILEQELADRVQLGFPPAARVLSATGARASLAALKTELELVAGVRILGISTLAASGDQPAESRLVATFGYQSSSSVAGVVKAVQLKLAGAVRHSNSGRARRPLTIKLDDSRVL